MTLKWIDGFEFHMLVKKNGFNMRNIYEAAQINKMTASRYINGGSCQAESVRKMWEAYNSLIGENDAVASTQEK